MSAAVTPLAALETYYRVMRPGYSSVQVHLPKEEAEEIRQSHCPGGQNAIGDRPGQ